LLRVYKCRNSKICPIIREGGLLTMMGDWFMMIPPEALLSIRTNF